MNAYNILCNVYILLKSIEIYITYHAIIAPRREPFCGLKDQMPKDNAGSFSLSYDNNDASRASLCLSFMYSEFKVIWQRFIKSIYMALQFLKSF